MARNIRSVASFPFSRFYVSLGTSSSVIRTSQCCKLKCHSQQNADSRIHKNISMFIFFTTQLEIVTDNRDTTSALIGLQVSLHESMQTQLCHSRFVRILEKFITKAIERFFRVNIASSKHSGGLGELSKIFPTLGCVSSLHNCLRHPLASS